MSNQNPKIKKVIDALSEGSQSVRNNPSEQNYREWEGKIEKAGSGTNWTLITIGVFIVICIFAFVAFSGGGIAQTVSGDNSHIDSISIDHNVYAENQKGMAIHITFDVDNRKNVRCMAVAYFSSVSGKALEDFNGSYATENGKIAVGQNFTPSYEKAQYPNLVLFMPYDELHMASGDFDLKFQVELYEEISGAVFAKSDYYIFQFSKK